MRRGYGGAKCLHRGVWGNARLWRAVSPRGISSQEKTTPHVRMSSLSDTLTIGVVLVLLFGSIALYLYTRIQQAEQKVNLLESILLDVKMSAEIKSYSDLPADTEERPSPTEAVGPIGSTVSSDSTEYTMLDDLEKESTPDVEESVYLQMEDNEGQTEVEELTSDKLVAEELTSDTADSSDLLLHAAPLVSYENMTLKDLQTLAKSRHITGVSTMKKGALVDALKASQADSLIEEIVA
jgi:hypothetical protein